MMINEFPNRHFCFLEVMEESINQAENILGYFGSICQLFPTPLRYDVIRMRRLMCKPVAVSHGNHHVIKSEIIRNFNRLRKDNTLNYIYKLGCSIRIKADVKCTRIKKFNFFYNHNNIDLNDTKYFVLHNICFYCIIT